MYLIWVTMGIGHATLYSEIHNIELSYDHIIILQIEYFSWYTLHINYYWDNCLGTDHWFTTVQVTRNNHIKFLDWEKNTSICWICCQNLEKKSCFEFVRGYVVGSSVSLLSILVFMFFTFNFTFS